MDGRDGHITREGTDKDLARLKRIGLGCVQDFDTGLRLIPA
ncbi:MAG: hypothetical protein ABW178_04865 [Pseudoxanthomonas sp.]